MSNTEYNGENIDGHCSTPEAMRARANALGADLGETIQIDNLSSCFQDIPPQVCSTLFPHDFLIGESLPDQGNSNADLHDVYQSGNLAEAAKGKFLECHPEEKFRPDPNASLRSSFVGASIASLIDAPDPSEPNVPNTDIFLRP